MSNERVPTGGEEAMTDGGPYIADERTTGTDFDELFEVLADRHRRRILTFLDDVDDGVAAFSELIEHVVADSSEELLDDRERVAMTLHHNHLPKLSDTGVVEYDDRSETIRYRGSPLVSDWVELVRSYESDCQCA